MAYVSDGTSWNIGTRTPWATAAAAWDALTTGAVPTVAIQVDAGTGATATVNSGSTRLQVSLTINTGSSVNASNTGLVAKLALSGFGAKPGVMVVPQDDASAAVYPYAKASSSEVEIHFASDYDNGTTYNFIVILMGK